MAKRRSFKAVVLDPGPPKEIMQGTADDLRPENLLFDPGNLRLLERAPERIQKAPAKLIGQRALQEKLHSLLLDDVLFAVEDLAKSIVHNGFLRHEQLIVAPYDGECFIVLEGNRRLCAVKTILLDKRRAESLSVKVIGSLKTLPCFVLDGAPIGDSDGRLRSFRQAAEIYVGMRHLMGARTGSLQVVTSFKQG